MNRPELKGVVTEVDVTDIVERLRAPVMVERNDGIRIEAANEIDRLRAVKAALVAELKSMTLLFRTALLSTSVEIAREAKPFLDKAEAAIALAKGEKT